jgi:RNA polymerase sigma factor (sigma-70 family)
MPRNSETRATLLRHLRDGADPVAWDEFFARYWPLIFAMARRRNCSRHTSEEIVQEVMLKVFKQRDVFQYDPKRGRFRDWLGTLVRNQVAEYRRRPAQRVRGGGGDSSAATVEPEDRETQPDAASEEAFEQSLLTAMLDVLRREMAPEVYLAFELFALQDVPCGVVSRATGLSQHAVYRTRRRVLQQLRQFAGTYNKNGQLQQRLKEALRQRPSAAVERSLTKRIEKTMQSR